MQDIQKKLHLETKPEAMYQDNFFPADFGKPTKKKQQTHAWVFKVIVSDYDKEII